MPNGGFRDPDKNWTWVGQADKKWGEGEKKEFKLEDRDSRIYLLGTELLGQ